MNWKTSINTPYTLSKEYKIRKKPERIENKANKTNWKRKNPRCKTEHNQLPAAQQTLTGKKDNSNEKAPNKLNRKHRKLNISFMKNLRKNRLNNFMNICNEKVSNPAYTLRKYRYKNTLYTTSLLKGSHKTYKPTHFVENLGKNRLDTFENKILLPSKIPNPIDKLRNLLEGVLCKKDKKRHRPHKPFFENLNIFQFHIVKHTFLNQE